MTPVTLAGFITKKEIEASYGRSYRSLTRDITRAVKAGDDDVLSHLKLVTEDEAIREGTEVTLDMIQDLSNRGLRPMWIAEEPWVAAWCMQRSTPRRDAPQATKGQPGSGPNTSQSGDPSITPTPTQSLPVELLLQRIEDQKKQIDTFSEQLQIKDQQIRTANQLAEQSQQLMRDLHVLLKNVQDGLLGEGSRRVLPARTTTSRQPEPTQQPVTPTAVSTPDRKPKRVASRSQKKTPKRTNVKKRDVSPAVAGRLERWFPTFLGSKRRGKP